MTTERVQGRRYKDEWAGCSCDLDLSFDVDRYTCIECGGRGTVDLDPLDDVVYRRARRTGVWTKRCGHCNGCGWHP